MLDSSVVYYCTLIHSGVQWGIFVAAQTDLLSETAYNSNVISLRVRDDASVRVKPAAHCPVSPPTAVGTYIGGHAH